MSLCAAQRYAPSQFSKISALRDLYGIDHSLFAIIYSYSFFLFITNQSWFPCARTLSFVVNKCVGRTDLVMFCLAMISILHLHTVPVLSRCLLNVGVLSKTSVFFCVHIMGFQSPPCPWISTSGGHLGARGCHRLPSRLLARTKIVCSKTIGINNIHLLKQ